MNIFIPTKNNNFKFKLGKKPKLFDPRNLKLAKYLTLTKEILPSIPDSIDWGAKINNYPMFRNDVLGDCVIAGIFHMIETWTSNTSIEFTLLDDDALKYYEVIGGYNPNDPSTDGGCVELDALKYWKNTGIYNHKIDAFIEVNLNKIEEVKLSIYLFGGLFSGIQLPNSALNQDEIWDVVINDGGSAGGHCIVFYGYDKDYLYFSSWGKKMKMTYAFFDMYSDENYAIVSKDWLNQNGISPTLLDLNTLEKDLKLVT